MEELNGLMEKVYKIKLNKLAVRVYIGVMGMIIHVYRIISLIKLLISIYYPF